MIESVQLKFGRGPGAGPQVISGAPITVFVGPNNSGKSKVLSEILTYCQNGQPNAAHVVLENVVFKPLDAEKAARELEKVSLPATVGDQFSGDEIFVGKKGQRHRMSRNQFTSTLRNPKGNTALFCRYYLNYNTLMLDGSSRINLVQQRPFGDMQSPALNSLQQLFRDDGLRESVRKIIHEAFQMFLVIDPGSGGNLRIRFSARAPADADEERGWNSRAVDFHAISQVIDNCSDGVKAFTGMVIEIMAGDPSVILIDEPEAFLHPALAFKLGKEISAAVANTEKRIFASTHSPQFLMGCIQSGVPINIVRLTYRGGVATARILANENLVKLMRNPLLRSADVMGAIFYESVVVAEGDTDRAFYQEVNERLLRSAPKRGIPNCLFLNAQNKQTIRKIIEPLRRLGIPAAAIVDIDVVKDGGNNWTDFLSSIGVPDELHLSLGQLRASVNKSFKDSGKCMKKDGGIAVLNSGAAEAAVTLVNLLAEYGGFVVPGGELESWLMSLGITARKSEWLIEMFERMGEEPNTESYVRPGAGDVWAFMDSVRAWLIAGDRKGIPA
jgi:ABC-type cobalamin/Fe3+-siderophores transport system ATPase subunit